MTQAKTADEFIARYTRRCARGKVGMLPRHMDLDDLKQEVYIQLINILGNECVNRLESALAQGDGFRSSAEYHAVKTAFWKAFDRLRSTRAKRKQRGLPQEVPPTGYEPADLTADTAVALIDQTADLAHVLNQLSVTERAVWDLAVDGCTVRKIGERLGIRFQRVSDMLATTKKKLAAKLDG